MERTQGTGGISAARAMNYGFTGPNLRAAGVDYDVRVHQPYSSYQDFNFTVPVGTTGDNYDRFLVRNAEMWESISIIRQAFKIIMGEIDLPKGQIYCPVEGGNGELGFYLISDGGRTPFRLHFRRPCFIYYQAYPELIKGGMLSDAVVTMSSLNLIAGELDA